MAEQTTNIPGVRGASWLWPALGAALTAAALWLSGIGLNRLLVLFRLPYPTDTLEGTLLHEARLIRAGEPLYQPLLLDRFVSAPYPPLHPLLVALSEAVPGPTIFWNGRLIALLAAFAVAICAALTVRLIARSWAAAACSAALLLSAPPIAIWGARIKPDMLGLAFTALGLLCATLALRTADDRRPSTVDRRPPTADRRPPTADRIGIISGGLAGIVGGRWSVVSGQWLIAAICCFVCAFFTKQTMVMAPLAVGLALLSADLAAAGGLRLALQRPRSVPRAPTWGFGLGYLVAALGVWWLLDVTTNGAYSLHVWWGSDRARWWSYELFAKVVSLLGTYIPLLLLALIAVIIALRALVDGRWSMVDGRWSAITWYALLAPLTLLGAGETGSYHNHLLETLLAVSLAGGALCGALLRARRWPAFAAGTLLLFQLWLAAQPHGSYGSELVPDPKQNPARFVEFIRSVPGEVLTDDPGLLLLAGKPVRFDDPSTQGPAATIGKWDQSGLLQAITTKRFAAILIPVDVRTETYDHAGRWTPEMIAAVNANYRLLYHDRIITYVPR